MSLDPNAVQRAQVLRDLAKAMQVVKTQLGERTWTERMHDKWANAYQEWKR